MFLFGGGGGGGAEELVGGLLLGCARAEVVEVKSALVGLSSNWLSCTSRSAIINSAEITLTNEIHQINVLVSLDLLHRLALLVKLVQDRAIKVILLITVVISRLLAGSLALKLVSIHAAAHFLSHLGHLALIS